MNIVIVCIIVSSLLALALSYMKSKRMRIELSGKLCPDLQNQNEFIPCEEQFSKVSNYLCFDDISQDWKSCKDIVRELYS
jgi:hypothetical protein